MIEGWVTTLADELLEQMKLGQVVVREGLLSKEGPNGGRAFVRMENGDVFQAIAWSEDHRAAKPTMVQVVDVTRKQKGNGTKHIHWRYFYSLKLAEGA